MPMQKEAIYTRNHHDLYQPASEFSELRFIEQLSLWSLRYWADCHKNESSPYEQLKQAYTLAKVKDAMPAFDGFMSVLVVGLYRQMDVRCLKCGGISDDEKLVLSALALEQRTESQECQNLIGRLLAPSAARIGYNMLAAWAGSLAKANHNLPLRDWTFTDDDELEILGDPAYYSPAVLH